MQKQLKINSLKNTTAIRLCLIIFIPLILLACTTSPKREIHQDGDSAPEHPIDWTQVKPAIPKYETKSRYGNPKSYEVYGVTYYVRDSSKNFKQKGVASWYGTKFHGRRTSSGETYDMLKLTAAHKTLPLPSYVKVTNLDNGKELVVKVNDRGPFLKSRIIDLSYAAAHKLGMTEKGTANVKIAIIPVQKGQSNANKLVKVANETAKPSTQGKYRYVQVGAYSNHANAQRLAKVLDREIKLPVSISSINRHGKKLYRVRIGPIHSLSLAKELAETLNMTELGKPSIVYQD